MTPRALAALRAGGASPSLHPAQRLRKINMRICAGGIEYRRKIANPEQSLHRATLLLQPRWLSLIVADLAKG
ncbi:hypothetical protein [Neoroseomonas oryzicola]|uniref:Uncharacterized protein n=1 Tax=Neoroseomonas oryzicola TaxID=535904 RepID=A0A9X9WPF2_9PROT|nr:hypothetical protein [Neoroseomonas oryzicola]MBR0662212.1 hypothetical protein [Neoroseomonas oryzicola]NKE20233.1 hypothetical protein [Neoroseomonas oryzicola]